ncbi:MAG: hypothetical protein Q9201_002869 [Fulgogasparrea decipioides]
MRIHLLFAALAAVSAARSITNNVQEVLGTKKEVLIELAPGETRWIAEDEKWALRREGVNFMDITDTQDLGTSFAAASESATVTFPQKTAYSETIGPLLRKLSKKNMRKHLENFTSFYTRYYKSTSGAESSAWLLKQVNKTVSDSGATKSGTVTILEALRVLLQSESIVQGNASNTVEFHYYSAEEGGLLGSQAIFSAYEKRGRDIKAMLQQDMTGYIHNTIAAGEKESVGVITDYVNPELTEFIKLTITEYCEIPYTLTKCGYACSDHASASKAGYPSAFVIESDFKYVDNKIHTTEDKMEYLSLDHMLQHARLTLAFTYELAFAQFT